MKNFVFGWGVGNSQPFWISIRDQIYVSICKLDFSERNFLSSLIDKIFGSNSSVNVLQIRRFNWFIIRRYNSMIT